jgi:hypothetical protein
MQVPGSNAAKRASMAETLVRRELQELLDLMHHKRKEPPATSLAWREVVMECVAGDKDLAPNSKWTKKMTELLHDRMIRAEEEGDEVRANLRMNEFFTVRGVARDDSWDYEKKQQQQNQ